MVTGGFPFPSAPPLTNPHLHTVSDALSCCAYFSSFLLRHCLLYSTIC